jgi:hypothetical protein
LDRRAISREGEEEKKNNFDKKKEKKSERNLYA